MPARGEVPRVVGELRKFLETRLEKPFHLRYLDRGVYNLAFRLAGRGIIRWRQSAPAGQTCLEVYGREVELHRFLAGTGITAELLDCWPEGPALLLEPLRGRTLSYTPARLGAAARLYRRLHDLEGPFPASLPRQPNPVQAFLAESRGYLSHYRAWAGANPRVVDLLQASTRRLESHGFTVARPCLTHGDASPRNWRFQQGRACLLDWDWCLVTTAAADMAHLFCPLTVRRQRSQPLKAEQEAVFWQTYQPEARLLEEYRRFLPVTTLRTACWVAARVAELDGGGSACLHAQLEPDFLEAVL
ncbi:MAG: phosphotransferase family protein [Vulcanimicrobiota bacterium]